MKLFKPWRGPKPWDRAYDPVKHPEYELWARHQRFERDYGDREPGQNNSGADRPTQGSCPRSAET